MEKQVKATDCRFAIELDRLSPSSEQAKSAPFEMLARTGDVIEHHYWGRVVHDLSGMEHKKRIPIDFNHNPNDLVGYANRFNTESGDLRIKGALTPYKDNDRATEILFKAKADEDDGGGVPYEGSINFAGPMEIEEIEADEEVTVNSRTFTGPLTVIRKWQLRGVAITPYGYDSGTMTEFADSSVDVTVREKTEMSKPETEIDVMDTEGANKIGSADQSVVDDSGKDDTPPEGDAVLSVDGKPETDSDESVVDGKLFMSLFGRTQGAIYFAEGISLEEANKQELGRLQKENAELKDANASLSEENVKLTAAIEANADEFSDALPDSHGEGKNLLKKMPGEFNDM